MDALGGRGPPSGYAPLRRSDVAAAEDALELRAFRDGAAHGRFPDEPLRGTGSP